MMETAINYIWSKLETIKYQVKNALWVVNQQT
jgi:hypothetical protein